MCLWMWSSFYCALLIKDELGLILILWLSVSSPANLHINLNVMCPWITQLYVYRLYFIIDRKFIESSNLFKCCFPVLLTRKTKGKMCMPTDNNRTGCVRTSSTTLTYNNHNTLNSVELFLILLTSFEICSHKFYCFVHF